MWSHALLLSGDFHSPLTTFLKNCFWPVVQCSVILGRLLGRLDLAYTPDAEAWSNAGVWHCGIWAVLGLCMLGIKLGPYT